MTAAKQARKPVVATPKQGKRQQVHGDKQSAAAARSFSFHQPIQRYAEEISLAQSALNTTQTTAAGGWTQLMEVSRAGTADNTIDLNQRGGQVSKFRAHNAAPTTGQGTRNGRLGGRNEPAFGLTVDALNAARKGIQTNAVGARADLRGYLKGSQYTDRDARGPTAHQTLESSRIAQHATKDGGSPLQEYHAWDLSSTITAHERHNMSADERARLGHSEYL